MADPVYATFELGPAKLASGRSSGKFRGLIGRPKRVDRQIVLDGRQQQLLVLLLVVRSQDVECAQRCDVPVVRLSQ